MLGWCWGGQEWRSSWKSSWEEQWQEGGERLECSNMSTGGNADSSCRVAAVVVLRLYRQSKQQQDGQTSKRMHACPNSDMLSVPAVYVSIVCPSVSLSPQPPQPSVISLIIGVVLKDLKRLPEAEACFEAVVRLRPNCALAHGNLAGRPRLIGVCCCAVCWGVCH